jgi:DNA-binding NarL/FixJ family response regulator
VIDDHPLLRDSLIKLVCSEKDITCCGEADNVADANGLVQETRPNLMLLDLRLKSGDALDLIKSMKVEQARLEDIGDIAA